MYITRGYFFPVVCHLSVDSVVSSSGYKICTITITLSFGILTMITHECQQLGLSVTPCSTVEAGVLRRSIRHGICSFSVINVFLFCVCNLTIMSRKPLWEKVTLVI